MTVDLYLGVGHGMQPNGVFDPGAVGLDRTTEHSLNTTVCTAAAAALARSGVNFVWEDNAGAGHDPDYRGSVDKVNHLSPRLAIEVHFDANNAPRGGFGIYMGGEGFWVAEKIATAWKARGLPARTNYKDVRGLWFLKGTHCPAVIWECDRTMSQPNIGTLISMGEAIAEGICGWLGHNFAGSPGPVSIPIFGGLMPDYNPPIHILGNAVSSYTPPEGGALMLTDLGFVYAWGNAQYAGSPQEPSAEPLLNWRAGHREGTATRIEASPIEGKRYRIWDANNEHYDFPL